jgi:hypothetical protein
MPSEGVSLSEAGSAAEGVPPVAIELPDWDELAEYAASLVPKATNPHIS